MDLGNSEFFADLKNLGLENLEDEATKEQREETQRRSADPLQDSFNSVGTEESKTLESETETHSEKPSYSMSDYKTQAEGYVDLLDLSNTMILPNIYKKKLLKPSERSRIETIKRTTEAGQYSTMSYEDQQIDKKLAEIQDLIDSIPFTTEEKRKLTDALAKVLSYYDMTANPTTVLILTLVAVEGSRLLPLVFRK